MIYNCPLGIKEYKYSDLGYYLLKQIIEKSYKDSLQNIANKYFYAPLGMNNTLYNPKWNGIDTNKIMPTEIEKNFRKTMLLGTVHDQGAALLGGVGGHAGIAAQDTQAVRGRRCIGHRRRHSYASLAAGQARTDHRQGGAGPAHRAPALAASPACHAVASEDGSFRPASHRRADASGDRASSAGAVPSTKP